MSHGTPTERRLDVREIDGEPFGEIVAALEERGFTHETERVGPEEVHVDIEPE